MKFRVLKLALRFVVALVVVAVVAGAYLFYRAMPAYSGSLVLPGLSAETRVWRDGYGAPHIFVPTLDDAARTLGYLHASERLYQMEMNRRAGQGRLAEVAGPDYLSVDRFIRTLGLLPAGSEQLRRAVALGAGAPASLFRRRQRISRRHRNALPPEFLILGDAPEPWTPADLLVWGKLMALQLSGNYAMDALRARVAETLPAADAACSSLRRSRIGRSPRRRSPARTMPRATARSTGSARC